MSSSPHARHPTGSDEVVHSTRSHLPTFESLRHRPDGLIDRAESSASGSRKSGSDGPGEQTPLRDSPSSSLNGIHVDQEGSQHRRNRGSGGFLLDSGPLPSRLSRTLLSKSHRDVKGKRKSDISELSIPKRRMRTGHASQALSIGSSPLASEIKPDAIRHVDEARDADMVDTDSRHSLSISKARPSSGAQDQPQRASTHRAPVPHIGYDTDPAQIVNMALSLSEGRRRQASAKRYISADQSGRRIVSTASSVQPRNGTQNGSMAQYITPRRQTSQSGSRPKSSTPRSRAEVQQYLQPYDVSNASVDDQEDSFIEDEDVSQATAARVEKAKVYFELAYEHRRLLSHLPPIHRPGTRVRKPGGEDQSKAYNPLQYIRNRKLRIWDKTAIDAEADGWYDVGKVRQWVDSIISSHTETAHEPEECVRLPQLPQTSKEADKDEQRKSDSKPSSIRTPRTAEGQHVRPRRPRSDWVTHPGDLIADCFWLEQYQNKVKILDRDNNQIYPSDTQFLFSGWRNRTPTHVPAALQEPTPPPEPARDEYADPPPSALPELPTFRSAHGQQHEGNRLRRKNKNKGAFVVGEEDRPVRRTLRLFKDDSGSDISDSSDISQDDQSARGRKLLSRKRQKAQAPSEESTTINGLGNPPTKDSASQVVATRERSQPSSTQTSKRGSVDHSRLGRFLARDSPKTASPLDQSRNRADSSRRESLNAFPPFEPDQPRSSLDYDSTAPSSPNVAKWPSIAINLSPPASRSPSPVKKPLQSMLSPFKDKMQHRQPEGIGAVDFADASKQSSRQPSSDAEKNIDSSNPTSRGTSPMTRGVSPLSKSRSLATQNGLHLDGGDHRGSTISRVSTKSTAPSTSEHSRLRGMFKGGRIAELVGNEVSRVGDFIWKRDPPPLHRPKYSVSDSSLRSRDGSDSEQEPYQNGHVYKTPPSKSRVSRSSTVSSTKSERMSPTLTRTSFDRPQYHNPNLPSFTEPFQRDREAQERKQALRTPTDSPADPDHISMLAAQHRTESKSPRLDRLAPPRLDTSGGRTPEGLSRQSSYGFGAGLGLTRSQEASGKLSSAISDRHEGNVGLRGSRSAMNLSSFNASTADSTEDRKEPGPVSRRDVGRAEAIILSSAVKAREIGRRADAPRGDMPQFLLDSLSPENRELNKSEPLVVGRREEHIVAARNIMTVLSKHVSTFTEKLKDFESALAPALHTELQSLEDMVDNKMTPRVRTAADEAGELSMKLTTTSTLAIKGLNDTIDGAMRRRRRGPVRWVRRLWYASIEWTVVGLLWGIWAVVTTARIVLGIMYGVGRAGRWLLWLD